MGSPQNGSGQRRSWWQGVEVRHFAALGAIAREGSFRGAAETLGYVQSAVSQQVAQLETLVGRQLVLRRRGSASVALTEAGELLLAHGDEIMARLGAAHADLAALGQENGESLRVGVLDSVETTLLPRVVAPLLRRRPELRIAATSARDGGELLQLLEAGKLDAAFCLRVGADAPLVSLRLLSDPFLLVVPAGSELDGVPEAEDLAAVELIGHDLMPDVESQLRRAGVSARVSVQTERHPTVQGLVAAGVGAAILPALAISEPDPSVRCLPLDGLVAPRVVSLAWQRGRRLTPALSHLVEVADRTGQALEKETDQVTGPPAPLQVLDAAVGC